MTRLMELEMTVNNLTTQKETVLLEKGDLTKTVEKVTSEKSWLEHTLTEKEVRHYLLPAFPPCPFI